MNGTIAGRREAIEPIVEQRQRELREALDDLQALVVRRLDVAAHIGARPAPWLIGGLLFGFWAGTRRE